VFNAPTPDSDSDGMPDVWEDANGLNKNNQLMPLHSVQVCHSISTLKCTLTRHLLLLLSNINQYLIIASSLNYGAK
jgi:hypothetical protein